MDSNERTTDWTAFHARLAEIKARRPEWTENRRYSSDRCPFEYAGARCRFSRGHTQKHSA